MGAAGHHPDERILTVVFEYGGADTGCRGFQDAVVDEGPDHVAVSVRLWDAGQTECSKELISEPVEVVLGRPLGQRALTGCAPGGPRADCRAQDPEMALMVNHAVTATGDAVVAAGRGTALAADPDDGRVRWEQPLTGIDVGLETVAGTVYVRADDDIVALDAATGAQRWRHRLPEGPRILVAGDPLIVAYEATVAALDPVSGTTRWGPGRAGTRRPKSRSSSCSSWLQSAQPGRESRPRT